MEAELQDKSQLLKDTQHSEAPLRSQLGSISEDGPDSAFDHSNLKKARKAKGIGPEDVASTEAEAKGEAMFEVAKPAWGSDSRRVWNITRNFHLGAFQLGRKKKDGHLRFL